jgi:hypothetical protein
LAPAGAGCPAASVIVVRLEMAVSGIVAPGAAPRQGVEPVRGSLDGGGGRLLLSPARRPGEHAVLQKLIIVDDFYDDPLEVRNRALKLEFPDHGGRAQYAGRNSRLYLLNQQMLTMISRLVGQPLVPARNSPTGHFRISLATDTASQDIHTDPARDWAGILYMNLPEQCRGGTSFFRHKALGIDEVPADPETIKRFGFKDREDMRLSLVARDGQDRSRWELTMTVPMRFNRLILFRPWMFHSFTENFGDSVETGRLIQVFFFEVAGTRPTPAAPPVGSRIGA